MSHVYRNSFLRTEGKFQYDRADMHGRVISKWIKNTRYQKKSSIHLAHDWDHWWARMDVEMNLWVL
jgi:hypothetical protein